MWRNTALPTRILFLDGRACLPLLVFVVYWSWPTFYIAIGGMTFFIVVSWTGLTVSSVLRLLRRMLIGPIRTAVPTWKRRRAA
jgi:intracellular multiplication protein IcmT